MLSNRDAARNKTAVPLRPTIYMSKPIFGFGLRSIASASAQGRFAIRKAQCIKKRSFQFAYHVARNPINQSGHHFEGIANNNSAGRAEARHSAGWND